jgi:acetyl-CoA carboxylase carboxyl transferase subunit alpha
VLAEPKGGAHRLPLQAAATLKAALLKNLERLVQMSVSDRQEHRYQKFRKMGVFLEAD